MQILDELIKFSYSSVHERSHLFVQKTEVRIRLNLLFYNICAWYELVFGSKNSLLEQRYDLLCLKFMCATPFLNSLCTLVKRNSWVCIQRSIASFASIQTENSTPEAESHKSVPSIQSIIRNSPSCRLKGRAQIPVYTEILFVNPLIVVLSSYFDENDADNNCFFNLCERNFAKLLFQNVYTTAIH